jgi:alginate O-acetyltransferase complex protein AlgI
MLFSSQTFLYLFLPLALLLHWLSGKQLRNLILLTLSLIFYAWGEPKYVLVLLLSILLNWGVGNLFSAGIPQKNYILIAGCSANILLLVFFKYFGFLLGIAGLKHKVVFECDFWLRFSP